MGAGGALAAGERGLAKTITKGCYELICEGELLEASGVIDHMAVDKEHKQWLGCSEWPL